MKVFNSQSLMRNTLYNYHICTTFTLLDDDLGYWVKPRSTTWFSRFLLEQYDNRRWVEMFRMTKSSVFELSEIVKTHVQRLDTTYRPAIPVLIRVACTLFKFSHGANFTICSELFAIGRSTVCKIIREVVHAVNDSLRHEISWPQGQRLQETKNKFKTLCGLPVVVGAIDGTHVSISKPQHCPTDYYYFKSDSYSVNCQAVVDSEKRFLDLHLGMPGSTNDSRVLRRSTLYQLANAGTLMEHTSEDDDFSPYLIGDLGYPLLPWLMVPHKSHPNLSISEALFNRKLRRGRSVVENEFGILKQLFRELLVKTDLHVCFVPDVILCCAILYNILLCQTHEEVEDLMKVLRTEGLEGAVCDEDNGVVEGSHGTRDAVDEEAALAKRTQLGVFLTTRRRLQR